MVNKKEKKILDLGCGSGLTTYFLSKNGSVIGVDLNITQAKQNYPNLCFKQANAEILPFTDCYFDKIYCFDVLEHVDNLFKALNEINRVLKPGGLLHTEVPCWRSEQWLLKLRPSYHKEIHHQRIFYQNDLENELTKRNFKIIKKKRLRGIDNLKLYLFFKNKRKIIDQTGNFNIKNNFFLESFFLLFKADLFKTRLKYFIFIWIITLPIGLLINQLFSKTIQIQAKK